MSTKPSNPCNDYESSHSTHPNTKTISRRKAKQEQKTNIKLPYFFYWKMNIWPGNGIFMVPLNTIHYFYLIL